MPVNLLYDYRQIQGIKPWANFYQIYLLRNFTLTKFVVINHFLLNFIFYYCIKFHLFLPKFINFQVCPSADGNLHMNLICPVDVETQPEGSLPDIENTEYAIAYLKNKTKGPGKDVPFFLGVGYYKPHIPFKFPREYLGWFLFEC